MSIIPFNNADDAPDFTELLEAFNVAVKENKPTAILWAIVSATGAHEFCYKGYPHETLLGLMSHATYNINRNLTKEGDIEEEGV